jgi:hypothetical protein
MTHRMITLATAAAVALGIAAIAHAQTPMNVKLGLWEMTMTNQMSGMPAMPQVDLSQLPPEQRARVEAMMKARGGMGGGQPMVTKQCITKEKLEKQFYEPHQAKDESCKQTVVSSTASLQELKVECTGNQKMAGTVRFEAVDNEHVKGAVHFDTEAQGHAMTVDSVINGKWVAADCGDVK